MTESQDENTIKSVETTFRIVEVVDRLQDPSLQEITGSVQPSKSTVYKHLMTLERLGYAERHHDGYRLTPKFRSLSDTVRTGRDGPTGISSIVSKLATNTGDVAGFFLLEGNRGYDYEQQTGGVVERRGFTVGIPSYLHASAPGKAILSQLQSDRIKEIIGSEGLPRVGPNTITNAEELLEEIDRVTGRGIAYGREEQGENIRGLATPYSNTASDSVGAVYIIGPVDRMDSKRFEQDLPGILLSGIDT